MSFFFGQSTRFLYVQVPGVDIVKYKYCWMVQHPADQYTHQKVQEIQSCMLLAFFFFCPILVCFLRMTLSGSLPFVTHTRGHMARTPLPSPLPTVLAFVLVAKRKKGSELGFLPWRPLASNWCVFMQPTRLHFTQHAGCEVLSAVSSHTDAFVSGYDLDPNEHIRHFLSSTCV